MRKSLLDDLEQKLEVQCLFSWVEDTADQLSQLGAQPNGYIELTPELAASRGIESIVKRRLPGDTLARILASENGYRIEVRPNLPSDLRRLAIAHEIGHTLWFAPGGKGRALSGAQLSSNSDPDIEMLSDRFAAALLLPRKTIRQFLADDASEHDVLIRTLDCIPELSRQHKIPERILAERVFFDLCNIDHVIFCTRLVRPPLKLALSESDIKKDYWKLSWSAIPHQARITAPRGELTVRGAWPGWRPRIPEDMIPDWADPEAREALVDSRWKDLARMTLGRKSRKPFKRLSAEEPVLSYVRRVNDRVFISFALDDIS